jgi:FtsZ-binding cell division protein ZapB
MQTIQQPLYAFFTASENRINQNIEVLKETTSTSLSSQAKLQDELSEFLGKYNVSSNKGKYGEQNLYNILNTIFQTADIRDTTGIKSSGDFIMERLDKPTILFENKDYKQNINKEEIAKFIFDIDNQNTHGIFLSQYSGIAFKQNYQIDIHKGKVLVYVQNCEYSIDKIRIAVDIIDNLSLKIQDLNQDEENNTISKEILDSINEEYQIYISQKENMLVLLRDFQKKMTTQIEDIKFPELDKYLSQKYAYVKARCFVCDLCNNFNASNKQSLSAHKRGCLKKHKPGNLENVMIKTK